VIVVVLEHGGSGSKAAGPIAREVIRSMAERKLLDTGNVSGRPE
jgi:cell division protein FtsI/penicillin-binding protein 2